MRKDKVSYPIDWEEGVELKEGLVFAFKKCMMLFESSNKESFKDTPHFIKLFYNKNEGRWYLPTEGQLVDRTGIHRVFIPATAKPGDLLRITWAEKNCACTAFN